MDIELKASLDGIHAELKEFRDETSKNIQAVKLQLSALEYSIITIVKNLVERTC